MRKKQECNTDKQRLKVVLDYFKDNLDTPSAWVCEDEYNPVLYCVYNPDKDPAEDECIFCGQPRELK